MSYDCIVVGGGTAGCLIASRLANALPDKTVLVLEAGKHHTNYPHVAIPGHYLQFLTSEDMSFTAVSVPQPHLGNRQITIPRAKVVGGGSCANFMTWARGPKCDWDEWAARTGDDIYKWDNILPILNDLETFEGEIPKDMEKFAKPTEGAHGFKGPIGVGYGKEWMPLIDTYLEAADDALKCGIIPDYNDGNVIGASVAQFNIAGGERITSPVAYLKTIPKNLILWTEVEAHKIVFEGKKAVGVEFTKDGKTGIPDTFQALNIDTVICKDEVILSCGTIGSPALLLRSGITTKQNPAIGQNLTDHLILSLEFELNSSILSHHQILEDPELAEKALLAYREGKSGDLVKFGGSSGVIFPRLPRVFESKEFKEIEAETQKFLKEPGRPSTEIWFMSGAVYSPPPRPKEKSYITFEGLIQNCLSRGTLTLDETNAIILDPNFLSHPYDLRVAIETIRAILRISLSSKWKGDIKAMLWGPEIQWSPDMDIDAIPDDVLAAFVRKVVNHGYHQMSTLVMGKDYTSAVDKDFKLRGVEGVRVVDLSVCPLLTNNHTQVNAYVIGEVAARKMIMEYSGEVKAKL